MRLTAFLLVLVAVLPFAISCGPDCNLDYHPPRLYITVRDDATGQPLCGASVTVFATPATPIEGCAFTSLITGEPPEITVSHEGYESKTVVGPTDYDVDECNKPIPRRFEVTLERI